MSNAQAIPGWQYAYSFDEIGNRISTSTNGRNSSYTANSLNQIENRSIPRAFDVLGKANALAAVSVNGQAASRFEEFFHKEISAGNGAVLTPYTVQASDGTGGKFLPASPENFAHAQYRKDRMTA